MKTANTHLKHIIGGYARAAVLGSAVLTTAFLAPAAAHAQVIFSVNVAPPVIPFYQQPFCPGDGYIWTPGYWAYGDDGYYWVDGAWVEAPYEGALWTPGYWGLNNGAYLWNTGYWGNTIGYYGGIDYGFGYFGSGFYGGRWDRGHFFYNSAYNRIDERRFRNVYDDRSHGGGTFVHPGGRGFDPHPRMDEHREANFRGSGFNRDDRGTANQGNRGNVDQTNRGGFSQNGRGNENRNDNRGGFNQQQNRTNLDQQNRTNLDQQNRGGLNQDNRANEIRKNDNRNNDNRNNDNRGNFNQQGNRPIFQGGDNQQRNSAAPPTQPVQTQPGQNPRQPYNGGNQNQGRGFPAPQQGQPQQQQQIHNNMQSAPAQQRLSQPQQPDRSVSQPQRTFSPPVQQTRPAQVYNAPQQQQPQQSRGGGGGENRGGGGEPHGGGRR